ncbi:Meiosis-specific with OB domain-containing protein [Amphibalanus amphitrite]|uniref:Meiosis-specific with OB domain-containing protein n=1 Tax=Amphibalanus amphitrite TaxID=1232801 RepID=A0A6A4V8Y9_AMPAM|nr:Meiosis-specific with OB domain-containing protein [Amphibalanus amphitrite]
MHAAGSTTISGLAPSLSAACSLAGLVIAKQDPRAVTSKRDPLTQVSVLAFTLRDSVDDTINVASWGSQRHVAVQAGLFHVGDTSTPFHLKLNESSSVVSLFTGDARPFRDLWSVPPPPLSTPPPPPLSELSASPSVQPVTRSILALVRRVGKPRDVNTRQGRQLQNCEVRLTDPSCNSFGLQLWDAELIRLAQQWTPWETVLLVTDCRIKYDAYRQTAVAVAGSQTVVTPEPRLRAAQALAQFGRRCRAERSAAELNSAGDEDINREILETGWIDNHVSSVRDSCSILELEKRLQQLEDVTVSHVVIVPAFVTWLPLESDRYKITRCGRCSRYVPETEGQCRNPDCVAGAGGQLQQVFSLRVGIADHQAGMEKLLLEGRHAETALGTTLSRFEAMTEAERLDLKHSWLMEHARLLLRTFGDPEVEHLYRQFHETARRSDVQYLLACALVCGALSLGHEVDTGHRLAHLITVGTLTALHALLLAVTSLRWLGSIGWRLVPFAAWVLFAATIGAHVRLAHRSGPTDGLEWYLLLVVLVCVCLPVTAGCVLLLGATALGTTAYLFTDLRQRRTYLETRKVIEVKTSIEEQSRTRVRKSLCGDSLKS